MIARREFLAFCAGWAALLASRPAGAIGQGSRIRIGQLKLAKASWNPRPTALRRMAWEIEKRTSVEIDLEPEIVTMEDGQLPSTPFVYLAGDREAPLPLTRAIENLRHFLNFGGFLLIDSAEGRADGAFDRSVRQLLGALFPPPSAGLQIVPGDHVIYKSFYLLQRPVGRVALSPILEGIHHDDRIAVIYCKNDLGGAWARDSFGNYEFRCEPGGERQRELSFRLGVNILMYALCLDYKTDQVHVPFILRRRRWRPSDSQGRPRGREPDRGR